MSRLNTKAGRGHTDAWLCFRLCHIFQPSSLCLMLEHQCDDILESLLRFAFFMAVKIYFVIFRLMTICRQLVITLKIRQYVPLKRWYPPTRLHGPIIQNTNILFSYGERGVNVCEQNLHLSGIKAQLSSPQTIEPFRPRPEFDLDVQ
jgi:hypothetical protein